MQIPEGDTDFEDVVLTEVQPFKNGNGWHILHGSVGYGGMPEDSPVAPKVGMIARFYGGAGPGSRVRGLCLDGQPVFYRTPAEDDEHQEIERYGKDAADWLARWDSGRGVWSIEMGGMGPSYEQCIQITAAEVLRHLLDVKYDHAAWSDKATWQRDHEAIEKYGFANERVKALGLSGAQWGAAVSLATKLYIDGPRKIMNEPSIKDRHIQVQRAFPVAA